MSEHIKQHSVIIESFIAVMDIFTAIYPAIPLAVMPYEVADRILFPLIRSNADKALTYVDMRKSDWQKIAAALSEDEQEQLHSALAGLPAESQIKIYQLLNINKPAPPAAEQETEARTAGKTEI